MTAGIDLSLTGTGVALSDGTCVTIGSKGVTNLPISEQIYVLENLKRGLVQAVTNQPVEAVCIEGLDMAQPYGGQIERTVLWWKVVESVHKLGIPVFVAPSPQVKMYATGKGAGPKQAVADAVSTFWPQFNCEDDNQADAAVCALIAAHLMRAPIAPAPPHPELDGPHLRALDSVRPVTEPPKRARLKAAKAARAPA